MAEPGQIQSVHRALDLLEALAEHGELGVTELADRLGLAVSTVHNLLRTLARRHYVANDRGRYTLGAAATVLTSEADPARALLPILRPALKRIAEVSGHTGAAVILVGHETRRVGTESGTRPVMVNMNQVVYRNPLEIAMGRLLVAYQPQSTWPVYLEAGADVESWTTQEWTSELRLIAETGLAIRQHQSTQVSGVAVPVWASRQRVICAIGCAIPSILNDAELSELTDLPWSIGGELSAELGCTEVPLPRPQTAHRLD